MISVKKISFGHSGELLYYKASFSVPKNKKAGLVGLNGSGKSTLFNLLTKQEWPDEGKIIVEGSILLVPQEVRDNPIQKESRTVRDYLLKARPNQDSYLLNLMRKMELGNVDLEDQPSKLSGGQKTKLAILFAVLSEPNILLLDEPTNFLDEEGKKWVMHWLSKYKKTLLVVSHDLDLLDRHIDKIIYINKQTQEFKEYTGNYSKFKRLKADRDAHLTRFIRNQEQTLKRMKKSVEKLRRSNDEKVIRQRVQLERRMQKIQEELPELPQELVRIKLNLPTPAHIGSMPLIVKNLSKSYGDKLVLEDVSFSIVRGQRIALIGHNGAGKSTLIKSVLGLIGPDTGEIILDEKVKIGYYSQEMENFDQSLTLFETLQRRTRATDGQIRSFLARFMFSGDRFRQSVGSLSGGEKTRLSIATLMLEDYNFLILDEPTTYLDVLSQRVILEALKAYAGAILVVSHTPEFLSELKPEKALLLPEERFVVWDDSLVEKAAEV